MATSSKQLAETIFALAYAEARLHRKPEDLKTSLARKVLEEHLEKTLSQS